MYTKAVLLLRAQRDYCMWKLVVIINIQNIIFIYLEKMSPLQVVGGTSLLKSILTLYFGVC